MGKFFFYPFVFIVLFNIKTINSKEISAVRSSKRSDAVSQVNHPTETSANHLDDPVRIAFFNGADYDAHVKINYIFNELQKETSLDSKILQNDERTMYLPNNVTNIRVRVSYIGVVRDGYVIDEQILNFHQIKERCYVLAGTGSRPIYGLCPGPFEDLVKVW